MKRVHHVNSVLVTGNLGYIGAVLTPALADEGYSVKGLDTGYYGNDCLLHDYDPCVDRQITKDIRDVTPEDFQDIDAVIHLAALSNDPLGELETEMTERINYEGTMRVARFARDAGVKRFVYVSSQSMYGISKTDGELDEDNSEKNPITAYAKTKWRAECELLGMDSELFTVVAFRPSTVFGDSPKLRLDIVYNNLLGCAFSTGSIEIKSDGTPWRPVIHIRDVCNALIAGLKAERELLAGAAFNIGLPNGNFTVREIAEAAQRLTPGSRLVFTGEHGPDSRTYRVSFDKILTRLKDYYQPRWDLDAGGKEMVARFNKVGFDESAFRSHRFTRLAHLRKLIEEGTLNRELRWN